jgi:hypothetical protein
MCGRVPAGTGTCPNFIPLTLTILLTDLARLQQGEGLMTLAHVPAVMTRKPEGEGMVASPQVVKTHERYTGVRAPDIPSVLKGGTSDFLKRLKILFSRLNTPLYYVVLHVL